MGRGELDCAIGVDRGSFFLIFDVVHAPPFFCSLAELRCCFVRLRLVFPFFFDRFLSFPDRQEWETGEYFALTTRFFVTRLYVIDKRWLPVLLQGLGQLVIPTFTGVDLGNSPIMWGVPNASQTLGLMRMCLI